MPAAVRSQVDSAIAKVKPALVRIRVVSTDYSDGREIKMQAVGSGAIITKDGYLITNHHVAGHAAAHVLHAYGTGRRSRPNWSAPTR